MPTMIWKKMSRSKRYREHLVSSNARRAFAFQLRAIMKKRELSQERLAEMCGLSQGMISRAADPNYGTLTVTIKTKIANGLDMAYLGTLVPFSDIEKWFSGLSEEAVQVSTFAEENASLEKAQREAELASYAKRKKSAVSIQTGWALAGNLKQQGAGGINGSDNDPKGQSTSNAGAGLSVEWGTRTH
jgi:transcriptional regulator with XRE-family HTH domain